MDTNTILLSVGGTIGAMFISWLTSIITTNHKLKMLRSEVWWNKKVVLYEKLISAVDLVCIDYKSALGLLDHSHTLLKTKDESEECTESIKSYIDESETLKIKASKNVKEIFRIANISPLYFNDKTVDALSLARERIMHNQKTVEEQKNSQDYSNIESVYGERLVDLLNSAQIFEDLLDDLLLSARQDIKIG